MQEHRFKVGQFVRFAKTMPGEGTMQRYKVLLLLPAEREGPQYRLKPLESGGNERIAREDELLGLG